MTASASATSSILSSNAWRFSKPILEDKCRLLFAGPHFQAALGYTERSLRKRKLWQDVEIVHAPTTSELMQVAPQAHVALPFMQRFPADFLQAAEHLRLVQQFGVGLEGVDIKAATKLRIAVANVPAQGTGNAEATAEHAIFLAISLLRRAPRDLPQRFQDGILGGLPPPKTLYGQNVTVVGFGNVGQQICRYCQMMGANVTAVRKRPWESLDITSTTSSSSNLDGQDVIQKLSQTSTRLEDVLPSTDVLILACPVTPETHFLMNRTTLPLLSHHALVINVGRGPLVEYDAIYEALEAKQIGGFASDVGVGHKTKPSEPWDPRDPLNELDNVLFTPHVGGYSELSYQRMTEVVVDHVERILHQKPPQIWVNQPAC